MTIHYDFQKFLDIHTQGAQQLTLDSCSALYAFADTSVLHVSLDEEAQPFVERISDVDLLKQLGSCPRGCSVGSLMATQVPPFCLAFGVVNRDQGKDTWISLTATGVRGGVKAEGAALEALRRIHDQIGQPPAETFDSQSLDA